MKKLMVFVALCLLVITATAQNVTNVRFEQEGKMVKIFYDLSEEADVSVYLSTDGGETYETSPLGHLSGHAGKGVAAGASRCAVWDVLADREKLQGSNIRFKIVADRRGTQTFTVGGVRFMMVYVEGGSFAMGVDRPLRYDGPVHCVTLSDYYIGETEVTQALWKAVMGTTVRQEGDKYGRGAPIIGEGDNYPMYYVDWEDCQEFCRKLSQKTGRTFRLPTEAEWEYASRGGNKSQEYEYSGSNTPSLVAWYSDNSNRQIHPVKEKQANELGLYDMSGNVREWCQDWYGAYGSHAQTNPSGPSSGTTRVCRGGAWNDYDGTCLVWAHGVGSCHPIHRLYDIGLRIVLVSDQDRTTIDAESALARAKSKADAEAKVRAIAERKAREEANRKAREEAEFLRGHRIVANYESGKDKPRDVIVEDTWNTLKDVMDRYPDVMAIVTGHTDNVEAENSLKLSQSRANNIKAKLVKMGIPANRITAIGKGDKEPVANNNDEAGRHRNRRVEITLYRNK